MLNLKVFLIAFFVGISMCYFLTPLPVVVYKFPSPFKKSEVYEDRAGSCYEYQSTQVPCDPDAIPLPVQ